MFQDRPPLAFVSGAASVALINDDEVEEVWSVLLVCEGVFTWGEGLEDREEDAGVWALRLSCGCLMGLCGRRSLWKG